ncbi:hypothetical protein BDU57DRAFT_527326 [Ampelomyces quisqualis]|uniref:Glycoside hydrolase/deacetylase n=1 Tax=Ampelomyces quisqualis TaxID=50730 RepID=A0A6A5QWG8_AMPQU|nr:hypothetical protein BDU57DRAFT_527326 [Ampelomyces quisqualis]
MRVSNILNALLVAPLVAAHSGVPGAPRIFGMAPNDIAAFKTRRTFGRHAARHAHSLHNSPLRARQGGADGRCGKNFGCATCAEGYCCSSSGYCGQGQDFCQAPDSDFDYGPGADANKLPAGGTTRNIARPKIGSVLYGGEGIYVCTKPGQIAITYDDGPYIYTNDLLDMFKSYNFKATFFVTGINLNKGSIDDESTAWPAVIRRMAAEGHQLASHTWSHQDLSAITKDQRYEQMVRLEMALSNIIGKFPTYMRPPYSSCSAESGCVQDMADLGYHISYFDLDTDDYNQLTADKAQIPKDIVKAALDKANSASDDFLAIAHDIHFQTVHNLTGYMLDLMVQKGYKGVTMGECLSDPEANWYRSPTGRVATSSVFSPPACASTQASSSLGSASVSASSTSSGIIATPTGVSVDGSCGPNVGLTCAGSVFGECCSQYGYCGSTDNYCGTSCNPLFGKCTTSPSSSNGTASSIASSSSQPASSVAPSSSQPASSVAPSSSQPTSSSVAPSSSQPASSVAPSSSQPTSSVNPSSSQPTSSSVAPSSSQPALSDALSSSQPTSSVAPSSSQPASPVGPSSSQLASSAAPSSSRSASSAPVVASSSASLTSSSVAQSSSSLASSLPRSSSTIASSTRASSSTPVSSSPRSSSTMSSSTMASSTRASSSTPVSSSSRSSSTMASSTRGSSSTPVSSSLRSSSSMASSSMVSSTRASSSPAPTPTGAKTIIGVCGPILGFHCMGFLLGECCGQLGLCGRGTLFCGSGCQAGYGKCN